MNKSLFENLTEQKNMRTLIEDKGFTFVDKLENNYDVVYSYEKTQFPFSEGICEYAYIKFPSAIEAFEFVFENYTKSQINIIVSSLRYLNKIFSIKITKDVDENNFVLKVRQNSGGVHIDLGYFTIQTYIQNKYSIFFGEYNVNKRTLLKELAYEKIYETILFEYKKKLNEIFKEPSLNDYSSKHFKALENVMTSHDLFALRTERIFKKERDYIFARKLFNFKNIEVVETISMSYQLKSKVNHENILYVAGDERIKKNVANTVKHGSTMVGFKPRNIDYLDALLDGNMTKENIEIIKKSLKLIITIEKAFGQYKDDAIVFERYNNDKVAMHNLSTFDKIVSIHYGRSNILFGTKISANMYGFDYSSKESLSYSEIYESIKKGADNEIAKFLDIPVENVTENEYHLVEMMHY